MEGNVFYREGHFLSMILSIFTPGLDLIRLGFFSSVVKSSPKCEWARLRKSKPGHDLTRLGLYQIKSGNFQAYVV